MAAEQLGEACSIEQRKAKAIDLYLKGHTQREIAAILGVSLGTINSDITAVRAEWRQERVADYDEHRQVRAQQIGRAMVAAWNAWERSQKDAESIKVSVTKGRTDKEGEPSGDLTKSEKQTKGQAGNSSFLDLYVRCAERLCRLYGLDAPTRTELSGPDGGPITIGTLLKVVGDSPPPIPQLESKPQNVLDLDSAMAELDAIAGSGGEIVDVECRELDEES